MELLSLRRIDDAHRKLRNYFKKYLRGIKIKKPEIAETAQKKRLIRGKKCLRISAGRLSTECSAHEIDPDDASQNALIPSPVSDRGIRTDIGTRKSRRIPPAAWDKTHQRHSVS